MVTVRLQCVSKISGILTGFLIKMSEVLFTFVCVFCQLGILRDVGQHFFVAFNEKYIFSFKFRKYFYIFNLVVRSLKGGFYNSMIKPQ